MTKTVSTKVAIVNYAKLVEENKDKTEDEHTRKGKETMKQLRPAAIAMNEKTY